MDLPDFDEPRDPDSFSKKQWARVPEPVRNDVEGYVRAHLPAEVLTRLRELQARPSYQSRRCVPSFGRRHGGPKPLPRAAQR
jgi:hypothetical protein